MDTFLRAFDLYITAQSKMLCSGDHDDADYFKTAFKVTGVINGYVAAIYNRNEKAMYRNAFHWSTDELIPLYYTTASQTDRSTGIKLEAVNSIQFDEIMYSVRKSEPQVTIRIQVNKFSIDFFAFPVKDEWQQDIKK